MPISLSTSQIITDAVQQTLDQFSVTHTAGQLINNQKFKAGYDDFATNKATSGSYIWEALSAVAEEVGQSLYLNVKNYIDNVSNVDTCKIRSLKAMMKLVDVDYSVLDKVGYYPLEIQRLMDILSISKKYLLSNKYIKQDFLNALCVDNVVSAFSPSERLDKTIDFDAESFLSIGIASSDMSCYLLHSNEAFTSYLSGIYSTFIYDMLTMHGNGLCSDVTLLSTGFLSSVYGPNVEMQDEYLSAKIIRNVNVNFDVAQVVNDIEMGIDQLDNYTGEERALLNLEIAKRRAPAEGVSALDLATRYIYYRKQKVLEYAKFVDNMVFLEENISGYVDYNYDKDYFTLLSSVKQNYCISNVDTAAPQIRLDDVDKAAIVLAQMTQYIAKLREVIRLQVRKVFMKGTNNLIKYSANEFLIDYANTIKGSVGYDKILPFVEKLSDHSIDDVVVQEYWDMTEYMNISAATTQYSAYPKLVNDRYFDQTFSRINGLLVPEAANIFTNEDLNWFYLDQLGLANTLHPILDPPAASSLSSNLYEFLSVLFDVAANNSYYNKDGHFGAKLSNSVITEEIDQDLNETKEISAAIKHFALSSSFEFDGEQTISAQMDSFANETTAIVFNDMMKDVSATYDTYSPVVEQLSNEMANLINEFDTCITATYAHYFCKSNSIYSYDIDGQYKFGYFVGNDDYLADNSYQMSSTSAREWINDGNCYTFSVSAAVEELSNAYDSCRLQIQAIIDNIVPLNFIDPDTVDLDAEMDTIKVFMNEKIQSRNAYLQNALENLRSQAADAKQSYDQINNTFSSVLASMPSLPAQDYYFTKMSDATGKRDGYRILDPVDSPEKDEMGDSEHPTIFDEISQSYFKYTKTRGMFERQSAGQNLNEKYAISESDSLEKSIGICIDLVEFVSTISYGASASPAKEYGTQKITLQSLQAGLEKISSVTLKSIIGQLNAFNVTSFSNDEYEKKQTCIEKIEYVIEYLNGEVIKDGLFANDTALESYYSVLRDLSQISSSYLSAKSSYEELWTEFDEFFTDYAKSSNYMMFIPDNIQKIDEYRQTKDAVALAQINEQFDAFDARYASLMKQFVDLISDNKIMLYSNVDDKRHLYIYNGDDLEYSLADFVEAMVDDIAIKEKNASLEAEKVADEIDDLHERTIKIYYKYFPNAKDLRPYSGYQQYKANFNAWKKSFTSTLDDIISKLEYVDAEEYLTSKEMFRNYSGVPGVAVDPYYNMKNQTHPSYQIHPFMWNFIEYHTLEQVIEQMSQKIVSLNFDAFESNKIASIVDSLIGSFGNVINVWKHNTYDFTGYTTKYEQSSHKCQYTGLYSDVVGYEGAFYPPALEAYRNLTSPYTLEKMSSFYSHLNVNDDPALKEKIDNALRNNYSAIKEKTDEHYKEYVYDIYKYYVDLYDNMYILYKKYNYDAYRGDIPEYDKMMTPGELWVRLADSPIAFPISAVIESAPYSNLNDFDVYDICMLESGTKLVVTGHLYGSYEPFIMSKPMYITYETNGVCGLGKLKFLTVNPNSTLISQTTDLPISDKHRCYIYVGSINRNENEVDVVYAEPRSVGEDRYNENRMKLDEPNIVIYRITQSYHAGFVDQKMNGINGIRGNAPLIAYHEKANGDSYVDLMFAASRPVDNEVASTYKGLQVDMLSCASGYIYDDPVHESMNSFDLMEQCVVMRSILMDEGNRAAPPLLSSSFQTNTDIGYTPSYMYGHFENVLDLKNDLKSSYQMIELLGKSSSIEGLIGRTLNDPDPYISREQLCANYMYGRVYEDSGNGEEFDITYDQSLNIYSNMTMYENMPNQYIRNYVFNYVNGHYQWNIYLDKDYSYEKLRTLRLFIFSTTSLGKNPYVVADMAKVIDDSNALPENGFLSTNYNAGQFQVTTCNFADGIYGMSINGTQNGIDQVDSFFSNELPNIEQFTYKYSTLGGGMYLKLDFKLKNTSIDGYIDNDIVKVALVDMFDMSFFSWYHYCDPGVTFGDYDFIVNRIQDDPLLKQQLLNVDLTQYDYLSDVQVNGLQIFTTNNRLSFKISEEDRFQISSHSYYVPFLNTKYPLNFAHAFDSQYNIPTSALVGQIQMYQPDEEYILEVEDSEILRRLGDLEIGFTGSSDDYRVYEDYYETYHGDMLNCERFSPEDPRFYQYVHLVTQQDQYVGTEEITVPDEIEIDGVMHTTWRDVRIDGGDAFSYWLNTQHVDPTRSEAYYDHTPTTRTFSFKNLDDATKADVIREVQKFMRLNLSYSKTKDGIAIYANYQNFVNSPYIKLEDGRPYIDIIPETYLKVLPGREGIVRIVIQIKQYSAGKVVGICNATIASYKICNVSDDKPKLILERMSSI